MSERTIADVQREYSEICGKLGHAEVQIKTLSAEIPRLHEAAQRMILESASIQAKVPPPPVVTPPTTPKIDEAPST